MSPGTATPLHECVTVPSCVPGSRKKRPYYYTAEAHRNMRDEIRCGDVCRYFSTSINECIGHPAKLCVAGINRSRATHSRRKIDQDAPASAVLD
jgi:hypothetical protein